MSGKKSVKSVKKAPKKVPPKSVGHWERNAGGCQKPASMLAVGLIVELKAPSPAASRSELDSLDKTSRGKLRGGEGWRTEAHLCTCDGTVSPAAVLSMAHVTISANARARWAMASSFEQ